MRKIKFRGKQIHGNEWLYGYYFAYESAGNGKVYHSIVPEKYSSKPSEYFHVLPETVSQFTGLTDKNGKEIYEGDVIQDNNGIGVIMWFQTSWGVASYAHGYDGLKSYTAVDSFYSNETKEWTVIGNIHDNPELLTNK